MHGLQHERLVLSVKGYMYSWNSAGETVHGVLTNSVTGQCQTVWKLDCGKNFACAVLSC